MRPLQHRNANVQEIVMSTRKLTLAALGLAAIVSAASMSQLAFSATERTQLGALNTSEGIYVNPKGFNIVKGSAQGDPTADLMKLGAKEVKDGAIIVRVNEKLYLVDADPAAKAYYTGWAGEAFGRGPGAAVQ
jgi:methyl coenzyme M reductase beta subunit